LSVGTYNGQTVNCTSTGATTKTVTFNGEVTAIPISVTTGTISTSPFNLTSCSDTETGTVAFTSTGTFISGNVYSVQLSDASGSFGSPIVIGTLTATANSGSVNITIPAGISGGTGYKMRVVSSNPSFTGTESSVLTISTACAPTFLEAGDLAILAFNTNVDGSFGYDEISFVSFVPINPGTVIDFTDNAYEKCGTTNGWGVSEGWFRMVRTSTVLPAGEVITVKVEYGDALAVAPDLNWSISKPQPAAQGNFDLNADGEQMFIMSGGNVGGVNSASPTSDGGTYSGYFLYGFNTKGNIWTPVCGNAAAGGTKNSAKPVDFDCFLVWPTSQADKNKYTGPLTPASQREWLYRINTPANWTGYADNATYEAGTDFIDFNGPNAGRTLVINANGFTPGLWTGDDDTDWHNCRNWQSLRVPDNVTDVTIPFTSNNPRIFAPNIGECNTILIETDNGAKLQIEDTAKLRVHLP
ncbi:MAG: putative adhesin, partial [Bacteroidota bacterium]